HAALAIMADAYTGLGLHDRAAATRAIMQGNHPPPGPTNTGAAEAPQALPAQTPALPPAQTSAPQ
ncbi:MAG TPA: hypothetical protein VIS52_00925, partial [Motiliproteus sp.]